MTDKNPDKQFTIDELIRIVRAELPWSLMDSKGLRVEFSANSCRVTGKSSVSAQPTSTDIAHGICRLRSAPGHLQKWATVILAATAAIDLSNLKDDTGEFLLETLWDISSGAPLSERAKTVVDILVNQDQPNT